MLLIAGTVPIKDLPLIKTQARIEDECLIIGDQKIPCTQGTGAMIGAAVVTCNYFVLSHQKSSWRGILGKEKGANRSISI